MNVDQVIFHLQTFHKGITVLNHHFDEEKLLHKQIHKNQPLLVLQNLYN